MKAPRDELKSEQKENGLSPHEIASSDQLPTCEEVDISLLEDSLRKTPWERMLANDDALRFAELLREAMEKRNASS